jgi:NAD(P)-dependent dehydrogenase (short-subunit alcohol dehydrogenase family)
MSMIAAVSKPYLSQTKMLVGKTAIVTGSTSGIGLACTQAFAKAGANVRINGTPGRRLPRHSRDGAAPPSSQPPKRAG